MKNVLFGFRQKKKLLHFSWFLGLFLRRMNEHYNYYRIDKSLGRVVIEDCPHHSRKLLGTIHMMMSPRSILKKNHLISSKPNICNFYS